MSPIVLYFLHSTSVFSFYINVVLTLSIDFVHTDGLDQSKLQWCGDILPSCYLSTKPLLNAIWIGQVSKEDRWGCVVSYLNWFGCKHGLGFCIEFKLKCHDILLQSRNGHKEYTIQFYYTITWVVNEQIVHTVQNHHMANVNPLDA